MATKADTAQPARALAARGIPDDPLPPSDGRARAPADATARQAVTRLPRPIRARA